MSWSKLTSDGSLDVPHQRQLAREVLDRLNRAKISAKHRKFVDQPVLASLAGELQRRAVEPVDPTELLTHLDATSAAA